MVHKIIDKGKKLFSSPQTSVLSAATIIMIMIVASRILGLIRQRTLAHFFTADELGLFFAAFRLPDMVFEVLVFGTFASAFIPVFAPLVKKDEREAWKVAAGVCNTGMVIFVVFAILIGFLSPLLYAVIAPGFAQDSRETIVSLTRILFLSEGFFVVSYVLTGVLESMRRFLVPALAPIFYNLGIILGTIIFASKFGLYAPVIGVVIGAFLHLAVQLPLAYKLGFRFSLKIDFNEHVRKIGKLALPRILEVSFLQLSKVVELFFSSLVSKAAYTYYTFGNTLQLLPVGLFGTSIAKAALPTLSRLSGSKKEFSRTLFKSLYEMTFLIIPIATMLIVLRIPVVRLVYGTDIFTWESTVQTSMVLSAFAFGIVFQAVNAVLARAFYALHDTKTPVTISVLAIILTIILDYIFIRVFSTPIWGLAAAYSIGAFFQSLNLYIAISRKINGGFSFGHLSPFIKHLTASIFSGAAMFLVLKFFDRSVWVKRLSFITEIETIKYLPFQKFVLDTRYTFNLLVLTVVVLVLGLGLYLGISWFFKTRELSSFVNLARRILIKRKVAQIPLKESESVTPPPTDSVG